MEVAALWPAIADALPRIMERVPDVRPVVVPAGSLGPGILEEYAPVPAGVRTAEEAAVDLMGAADAAIVASGTASLELAILGTPAVILYKVNTLTWELGRRLVYVTHLGLPNIIAGKPIVPELLQGDVRPRLIAEETAGILTDGSLRERIAADYGTIREALRPPPTLSRDGIGAPACAARLILDSLV
jgi:lipid-A-disaccharide synthase